VLRAEHLVGRSTRSDLCIEAEHISIQHAAIRWNGESWEIRDLGSRNGTRVEGSALAPGEARTLRKGAQICFGDANEAWTLLDDSPPQVLALSLETDAVVLPEGDILAIPSSQAPEIILFRNGKGVWEREEPDGTLKPVQDQDRLATRDERWLFCWPHVVARTSAVEDRLSFQAAALELRVSRDEEHVEATLRVPGRMLRLGARAHHYLLLILARHRLDDQNAGHLSSACGWVYVEELLDELRVTPEQLNLDVFRIRQQFSSLGFSSPAEVIERRPRTRQLRLGIADLLVDKI
jgi:pSer/pThr/pTyr-binding forkhead associated (FHA) protein